jgi:hypothetical protein
MPFGRDCGGLLGEEEWGKQRTKVEAKLGYDYNNLGG